MSTPESALCTIILKMCRVIQQLLLRNQPSDTHDVLILQCELIYRYNFTYTYSFLHTCWFFTVPLTGPICTSACASLYSPCRTTSVYTSPHPPCHTPYTSCHNIGAFLFNSNSTGHVHHSLRVYHSFLKCFTWIVLQTCVVQLPEIKSAKRKKNTAYKSIRHL